MACSLIFLLITTIVVIHISFRSNLECINWFLKSKKNIEIVITLKYQIKLQKGVRGGGGGSCFFQEMQIESGTLKTDWLVGLVL